MAIIKLLYNNTVIIKKIIAKIIVIWLSHNIRWAKKRRKFGISWLLYYIQATLFILKRQNPLSSPIFSFKAS